MLTGSGTTVAMARAVAAGAAGVMHKARPVSEVVDAIRRLHAGEPLLSLRETIEMLGFMTRQREQDRAVQATIDRLTPREREVLQALAAGLSDREIAEHLFVRPETVRTHMVNLLGKLGVDSRLKALVFAVQHNLVTFNAVDEVAATRRLPVESRGGSSCVSDRVLPGVFGVGAAEAGGGLPG